MSLSFSSIVADLENVVADAQKAVPALELVQSWLPKVAPLLPAADQALVADVETALAAAIDILSKA
jgi:hypothetical protein